MLDKIYLYLHQRHSANKLQDMRLESWFSNSLNCWESELSFFLAGKTNVIKYPSNWIEAIKDRWLPKWALKYIKIKYIEIKELNLCPHIMEDFNDHTKKHIDFIMFKEETSGPK